MRKLFGAVVLTISLLTGVGLKAQLPHNIPDFCAGSPTTISVGQTQTWNSSVTADCVAIKGTLVLTGELKATTVMVYDSGFLDVKSGAKIIIRDTPINVTTDPERYGTGLLVFGRLTVTGQPKTAFVRLGSEPRAGQSTITVAETITGWAVGDRIVIPGTNQHWPASVEYVPQWEVRTLTAVNESVLTLDRPLTYDHLGARDHTGTVRFLPHVGNLSRDTVIRSQNPNGTRGHVLIAGTAQVDVQYVRFEGLGRTTIAPVGPQNIKGRYPFHDHMPEPSAHVSVIGSVVEDSPKWGIFIHRANGNIVRDNVVFNVGGAGIGTEDGSERDNTFDHNLVVAVWGTGDDRADNRLGINDYGFEGSPFWFRSPHNTITRNVAANSNSYAYSFFMIGGTGEAEQTPFGVIDGNEAYSTFLGWTIWHYLARCAIDAFDGPDAPIRNTILWHIGKLGYYGYCTNHLVFDGWTQINRTDWNANVHEGHTGFFFGDYIAPTTVIRRAYLYGMKGGIAAPSKVGDIRTTNRTGTLTVEDSTFGVQNALWMGTPYGVAGGGGALTPRVVTLRNVTMIGAGTVATLTHNPDYTNANWMVSDRLMLDNAAGLTGEAYRTEQRTNAWYGGLAPANATTTPRVSGLFLGNSIAPPPVINCQVSEWSDWFVVVDWHPINSTTEERTLQRTRTITVQPANGGTVCPSLVDSKVETREIVVQPPPPPPPVTETLTAAQVQEMLDQTEVDIYRFLKFTGCTITAVGTYANNDAKLTVRCPKPIVPYKANETIGVRRIE